MARRPTRIARLAEELIADAIHHNNIARQLTLHADRGSSMTSKTVTQLLADLGVPQSHSRPHVSNDNPYSEAQFKTLKYFPTFPKRFANIAHARSFCDTSSTTTTTSTATPASPCTPPPTSTTATPTHITAKRQTVLDAAYTAHPDRFRQPPHAPQLPTAAWINQPQEQPLTTTPN